MNQGRSHRGALIAASAALAVLAFAATPASATTWLCRPGLANNPCASSLTTTRVSPTGQVLGTANPTRAKSPKVDCFYVYPTVSDQRTPEANLTIDPEERSIALYQAARYSQVCRVFAPMYRQITLAGLATPSSVTAATRNRAYADVRDAWRTYLRKFNKGRGVVLIGHSQGTFVLRALIAREIDGHPVARKRLVSAILLGGNVLVKRGKDVGGDFKHVRACHSNTQLGCVVAFSTFNQIPPADTLFGRPLPIPGVGPTHLAGTQVLCTNPAALAGGSAPLRSVYPTQPFAPGTGIGIVTTQIGFPQPAVPTAWIESDGAYIGHCSTAGGASVLLIRGAPGAPVLNSIPLNWGLHLADGNIALGDLVDLVRRQSARYAGN